MNLVHHTVLALNPHPEKLLLVQRTFGRRDILIVIYQSLAELYKSHQAQLK